VALRRFDAPYNPQRVPLRWDLVLDARGALHLSRVLSESTERTR
jgi:hypothetical protein